MKPTITLKQLFSLIILFQIGSTTMFSLGIAAKEDAWITIIVAMFAGFILLWIYTEIQKNYPEKNFTEIIIILLGKPLGIPLVFLYALYFIHISTLNLNEFCNLVSWTYLTSTPLIVIMSFFMFFVLYALFCGFHVFAGIGEIMINILLFFLLGTYILIILTGNVNLSNLKPILANGITPVLKAAYPQVINFPFGEMVVFLMYWCYIDTKKKIRKVSFISLATSGITLVFSLIIYVSVLGVRGAERYTFPFLSVVKLINVGDFFKNLDAIGIINLIIGGYFKMTTFFYAGVLALNTLFKMKNEKLLIAIVGIFTLWASIATIPTFIFQKWLGQKITTPYIHVPFQIIFPTLLLIINWLKTKRNASYKDSRINREKC